jgi:DNA processing protein
LLTEFHSKTLPDREHFPMRNRIIAAMCDALIVIETNVKGGSVISAKLANGYNKDVFAFPGRVNDTKSKGCNMLIKSHQASLIETVNDVVYVMRWNKGEKPTFIQKQLFYDLGEDEKYIVDLLRQEESLHIDQLMFATKKTNSEMVALLLEMEFNGILKSLPGKHYMLII